MEDLRHQIEASLSRTRNVIMEDRYRRLHYDPTVIGSPYWTQPPPKNAVVSNGRLKKHLPTIPKKKSKDGSSKTEHFDVPNYLKPYRDKYGSVSAHSTSAIYGALRAPHCHAMYNPSDMWYASVRSLNSRPRDVVYPAEAYDWREPIYEDLSREGCPISPPHDLHHRPHCCCMIRRKPPSTPLKSSRPPPRCKYCASVPLNAGSLKGVPLSSKRTSLISDKVKLVSVSEEKDEIKSESTDRMSGYKKRLSGSSKPKSSRYLKETAAKEAMMISRKSILECDVTAYDLIKKTPKSPSISEVEDSDIDDDLSDNAVVKQIRTRLKKNQSKTKASSSKIEGLVHRSQKALSLSKFQKSQSENNIYNEATSVLLGGQRIFTNHQSSKSPDVFNGANASNENVSTNGESCSARWRKISVSEESVCIPEPDYDNSEDSDDARLNNSFKDLKLTYSPPLLRKSSLDSNSGLGVSRELSKSMSSLLSEDTIVPNISLQHSYKSSPTIIRTKKHTEISPCHELNEPPRASKLEVPENSVINIYSSDISIENLAAIDIPSTSHHGLFKDTKFESFSSSDCSSNGGTLSSDYPTWTSSSSSELKSILKKKRRRENVIQEREVTVKASSDSESKDSQRKKQVQFRASADDTVFVELIHNDASQADKFAQGVYAEVSEHNAPDVSLNGTCDNAVISNNEKSTIMSASSVIECNDNIYESISKATNGRDSVLGKEISASSLDNFMFMKGGDGSCCGNDQPSRDAVGNHSVLSSLTGLNQADKSRSQIQRESITPNSILEISELPINLRNAMRTPVSSPTPKLSGRSSSLEDIRDSGNLRNRQKDSDLDGKKGDPHSRRRRTTLPKRRFSDLHLHILLCPTRTSLCGDGSSSDDVPLTTTPHRAHRSLPESPSELDDETPTFCFEFIEKTPKEKVLPSSRSTFYVSVDGSSQPEVLKKDDVALLGKSTSESTQIELDNVVAPSIDSNLLLSASDDEQLDSRDCDLDGVASPLQEDTDEDNLENEYENLDPIYEELSDVSNSSKRLPLLESPQKSFFEGASKTDILSYLEDAKERGLSEGLSEDEIKAIIEEDEDEDTKVLIPEDDDGEKNRVIVNNTLNHQEVLSEGDEAGNSLEHIVTETITEETNKVNRSPSAEVERNDSGVGAETSKPSRISKLLSEDSEEQLCADCDHQVEPVEDELSGLLFSPLVCRKCDLRRCERKEIIIEFVDTELKYGRDLRIIKEEFYRPMEIAGLLAKEQLLSVFLNLDELTRVNTKFSEKLQDALDIAMEQGDEDYTTVHIGKIFLETSSMLHAFETYCVKQASASVILNNLEKEKELLRIFLRVSQMENTLLRRMNLPAFLMVPVQRVTRYPLLLTRLHKVTPIHHKDRNALKEAQQKVELHLEHINQQTKGVGGTKIWRRISNISASHRRLGNLQDIGSIKLRKMALEILKWKQDEVRFVMAGKLLFTQVTDYPWNKKGRTVKFTHLHALLVALGKPNSNYRPEMATTDSSVLFPRNTGIRDACLILMKEKNGRFIFVRDPLYLGSCVISCDSDADDVFEIQEYTTKEAYLLKGESKKDTKEWLRQLRYHAKDLGSWRRRRNALANIMINGMIRQ